MVTSKGIVPTEEVVIRKSVLRLSYSHAIYTINTNYMHKNKGKMVARQVN